MLSIWKEYLLSAISLFWQLRRLIWKLSVVPVGFGRLIQFRERVEMGQKFFGYKLALLPVPAGVAQQRLVVKRGEEVLGDPITVGADVLSVEFEAGPEGAEITLSLDYLDDSGNDSTNLEQTFVVADTIAPDAPAGFGELVQTREFEVLEDPAPIADPPA